LVELVKTDWTKAPLGAADRALLAFAVKLTATPAAMTRDDVVALRAQGFDDRAVSDAVQIAGYFNYINRVADGLGVDLEEGMPAHPHLDRARHGHRAVE
jgi:uncharacterized peroxidase-related enzyme